MIARHAAIGVAASLLAALTLLPHPIDAGWRGVDDYECDGKSLSKIDGISNMNDCKKQCDTYRGMCGAATYDTKENICHLQAECSKSPDKGKNKGFKSVVAKSKYTKLKNTDCSKGKVLDTIKKAKNLKDCKIECDLRADCVAVTLNEKKKKCELLKDCTKAVEDDDKKSAIKQAQYTTIPEAGCEFVWHSYNPGFIAPDVIIPNVTLSECQVYCDSAKDCQAASYDAEAEDCYIGEGCGQVYRGIRDQGYPWLTSIVKRNSYSVSNDMYCKYDENYVPTLIKVERPFVFAKCLTECDKRSDCKAVVAYNGYAANPGYEPETNCALFTEECEETLENLDTVYATKYA